MSNLIYSNQRQAYGEELLALGAKTRTSWCVTPTCPRAP